MSTSIDVRSEKFSEAVYDLVRRAACELPDDVIAAMERARSEEEPGSTAELLLSIYLKNIEMAKDSWKPACQDT